MAKRGSRRKPLLAALVALILLAVVFYAMEGKETKTDNLQTAEKYQLEKTGAGTTADFTPASGRIHAAVDAAFSQTGIVIKDATDENKEVKRQQIEGTIRWHVRQLHIHVDDDAAVDRLKKALSAGLKNAGGEILAVQSDHVQGQPAVRLDVGLRDKLDGDEVTIVTDKIFVQREPVAAKRPAAPAGRGEMALIIDDFGYNSGPIEAFAAINKPLTFAVIPYHQYSNQAAARGLSSGHQVILHLPMEPLSAASQSESATITVNMSDEEIQAMTVRAIQAVPGIIGVNNHQGSRATADKRVMQAVLSVLKSNNLFFIDSHTNSQSIGMSTARQMGVRTAINDLFIDNDNDVAAIKSKLRTACNMAVRDGSVIVIGHARMNTAAAVREMIPEIEAAGIRLVFVSEMAK